MATEVTNTEEELVDYDDIEKEPESEKVDDKDVKKGHYVGIHSSSFRDFILKPEILRAIGDCGFEHPSEVQHACIPQATTGCDVICQAKSGMGKTAVFVLATLQQIVPVEGEVSVLVLCHVRELAFQIAGEYQRFGKYMPHIRTAVFYGGVNIRKNRETLRNDPPHIVVGTPGRILQLARENSLDLQNLKIFILDECDRLLEELDMRRQVQEIFKHTPHQKQVMMFSATLSDQVRPVCRKFCQQPLEVLVDDEAKLTLHGLQQYYVRLDEQEKNLKLNDLLDALQFNQVVIFVSKVARARELARLLNECNFPATCIHSGMTQEERINTYKNFKAFKSRVLVSTDLVGRGIDIEHINIVINYDFPHDTDQYLHRVGRAGRFGTKGLAVSFISTGEDAEFLEKIQSRFEVNIPELPEEIDTASYLNGPVIS